MLIQFSLVVMDVVIVAKQNRGTVDLASSSCDKFPSLNSLVLLSLPWTGFHESGDLQLDMFLHLLGGYDQS